MKYLTKHTLGALLLVAVPLQAGEFLPADENPIPDHYIVVLRAGVARPPDMPSAPGLTVAEVAQGLVMFHGGKVERVFEHALQAFVARAEESQARAMAADRRVAYVEQDRWLAPFATQSFVHWGLDRSDERDLPRNNHFTYNNTGAGVRIYVIDTGINSDAEFGTRKVDAFTTVLDGSGNPQHGDCNGHGTNVAKLAGGATSGVAKSAQLYAVRVGSSCSCAPPSGSPNDPPLFGPAGCGFTLSDVISGVNWVTTNRVRPAVANLSLGGPATQSLDDAVRGMHNASVTVVAAAGNSGVDACGISPARVGEALTVGASDINDSRAFFTNGGSSNIGSCIDLFAPGKDVNGFGGTSAAAPLVAGAAAQYLQTNTLASPATVVSYVVNNASVGKLANVGTGSPNRLLFVPPGGTEIDNLSVGPMRGALERPPHPATGT